jgi:acetyl-CoA carboxylase biotin carboxyl carrier protein
VTINSQPVTFRIRASDVVVEWELSANAELPIQAPVIPAPVIPAPALAAGADVTEICAPTVGAFYHASAPGETPFVAVGDRIRPGQQVGLLEAMKLMIPVEADCGGQVAAVLVADGVQVEYGTPLIAIVPLPAS